MTRVNHFDVLLLGGGPAGTAAALTLARAGMRVAVLERSAYDELRVGETFPPNVCAPLQSLGVWETFRRAGHCEAPGIVSCWGSDEPFENDFLFNPFGCGWHVDRVRFDRMLAEAAQTAGAELFLNTRVTRCKLTADDLWRVNAESNGDQFELRGDWLIDATGRAGRPGQSIPRAIRYDRLIACVAFFQANGTAISETRTIIEARPQGWWYSAPLPDNRLVMAWMTDTDLFPATSDEAAAAYRQRLQETTLTKRWLTGFTRDTAPRRVAAHSSFRPATGKQWLATGDAALAFDPLSSQGTLKALIYGRRAAQTILAANGGDAHAVSLYAAALVEEFQQYRQLHNQYYRQETRWPESLFWRRRQHPINAESIRLSSAERPFARLAPG